MTDDEERKISTAARAAADMENRVENLEKQFSTFKTWSGRTVWATIVYLAAKIGDYLTSAGKWP